MPKIYIIPGGWSNAFATGRNPQHAVVACTAGILQILDRDELRGVLAQRLVRTLSQAAKAAPSIDVSDPSIYDGRIVLPELLTVSPKLRDMVLMQEQETAIEEQAKRDGYLRMKEYGTLLVDQKLTTREEVERVTA